MWNGNLLPSYFSKRALPAFDALRAPKEWQQNINNPTPGYADMQASALSSLSPPPGTIITLASGTNTLAFNENFSGWRGTKESPIWVIGQDSTIIVNKQLECWDHRWVNFGNIRYGATVGTNQWNIERCLDCAWDQIICDGGAQNNILVNGPADTPNSRLRFFNIDSRNAAIDCFTIHADGTAEKNNVGTDFIIKDWYVENQVGATQDSGMDITSGTNIYLINGRSKDAEFHIAHGVRNVYVGGHINEGTSKDIKIKNTDLDLVLSNLSGTGELDFGVQSGPRANEEPNRLTGAYTTGRAKLYNFGMIGGIDNNTGVDIVYLNGDPIPQLRYMAFA